MDLARGKGNKQAKRKFTELAVVARFPLLCPVREYEWIESWNFRRQPVHENRTTQGRVPPVSVLMAATRTVPFSRTEFNSMKLERKLSMR
jgi:hypothetical protein